MGACASSPVVPPSSIVISGASNGIGAALALRCAAPGVTLGLTGRNGPRLDVVADACRRRGAEVFAGQVDVGDASAMETFILKVDSRRPIDLVVANAGILPVECDPSKALQAVAHTNLLGTLNTLLPAVAIMRQRHSRGPALRQQPYCHLAVVSSISALPRRGVEFAGMLRLGLMPYTWSKRALLLLAEGLRSELQPTGITVSAVCPPVVATDLAADASDAVQALLIPGSGEAAESEDGSPRGVAGRMDAKRRLRGFGAMSPHEAAEAIYQGLLQRKAVIAFPSHAVWRMRFVEALPLGLVQRVALARMAQAHRQST